MLFFIRNLDLDQLISRNYGRLNCGSHNIFEGLTGGSAQRDAQREQRKAQKAAESQAAEASRAAASARPNSGGQLNSQALNAAMQHRRGIQSTFLASRKEDKLGA